MRINEDYIDSMSDIELIQTNDDHDELNGTRDLPFKFRIVSEDDYKKHLNTEASFRKSIDLVASRCPNIMYYKVTSVSLPTEEDDRSIALRPVFVEHKKSMDFIADVEMEIRKFNSIYSMWTFIHMLHNSVRSEGIDKVILYLTVDNATIHITEWYILG